MLLKETLSLSLRLPVHSFLNLNFRHSVLIHSKMSITSIFKKNLMQCAQRLIFLQVNTLISITRHMIAKSIITLAKILKSLPSLQKLKGFLKT